LWEFADEFLNGDRLYRKYSRLDNLEGIFYCDPLFSYATKEDLVPYPTQNQIQRWLKKYLPEEQAMFYGFQSFFLKRWMIKNIYSFDELWLMFFLYYVHNLYWDQVDYEWKEIPEERSYRISS
jgi:hypothetical protein